MYKDFHGMNASLCVFMYHMAGKISILTMLSGLHQPSPVTAGTAVQLDGFTDEAQIGKELGEVCAVCTSRKVVYLTHSNYVS